MTETDYVWRVTVIKPDGWGLSWPVWDEATARRFDPAMVDIKTTRPLLIERAPVGTWERVLP